MQINLTCKIVDSREDNHNDIIDSFMYSMYAKQEVDALNHYYQIHVKSKPRFLPEFIRKWILWKVIYLAMFRKK